MGNTAEKIIFVDFEKSGGKVAVRNAPKQSQRTRKRPGKTTLHYWKKAIFRRLDRVSGVETGNYLARIQQHGKRREIDLDEDSKDEAAEKALHLYLEIRSNGWPQSEEATKPPQEDPSAWTLGEYLEQVTMVWEKSPLTLGKYLMNTRRIFQDIAGLRFKSPSAPRGTSRDERINRIDKLPLTLLTEESLQAWRTKRLREMLKASKRLSDEEQYLATRSAKTSINTYLRSLRSIFRKKLIKVTRCPTPPPIDWSDVDLYPIENIPYQTSIEAGELLERADAELKGKHRNAYLALCLALYCGLRRSEIDNLQWKDISFHKGTLTITRTIQNSTKTTSSIARMRMPEELQSILKTVIKEKDGAYVIESDRNEFKRSKKYSYYRAAPDYTFLCAWLRDQGVKETRSLHSLRKEFGSIMAAEYDINVAARALRHSGLAVASAHYVAIRETATLPPLRIESSKKKQ